LTCLFIAVITVSCHTFDLSFYCCHYCILPHIWPVCSLPSLLYLATHLTCLFIAVITVSCHTFDLSLYCRHYCSMPHTLTVCLLLSLLYLATHLTWVFIAVITVSCHIFYLSVYCCHYCILPHIWSVCLLPSLLYLATHLLGVQISQKGKFYAVWHTPSFRLVCSSRRFDVYKCLHFQSQAVQEEQIYFLDCFDREEIELRIRRNHRICTPIDTYLELQQHGC